MAEGREVRAFGAICGESATPPKAGLGCAGVSPTRTAFSVPMFDGFPRREGLAGAGLADGGAEG